jgi:hypothetical protein
MDIITVPELQKPTIKNHHKARHMKKMAVGPFSVTCAEIRFSADIEKFDQVDSALIECQQNWELFIAYFNDQYHVAINFLTEQEDLNDLLALANAVITKEVGEVDLQVLVGDANYGDWDSCYAN